MIKNLLSVAVLLMVLLQLPSVNAQDWPEVARNKFVGDDTDFNASPAISENKLYLRSNKALYCVGEK